MSISLYAQDAVPDNEDNHQCYTMTPKTNKDQREGFVCERTTMPLTDNFTHFY